MSSVVIASAGVVPVPPIGGSGVQSLTVQPSASAIAITVAIITGPPTTDSNCHEAVVEVIVAVSEVLVMVMPSIVIAMPSSRPVVPGIAATAAAIDMPTTIPTPTGIVAPAAYVADMPATTPTSTRVVATSATHAAKVATSTTASEATAAVAAAAVADQRNLTVGRAERTLQVGNAGVCLPHYYRGKKQAACEGSCCSYPHSHKSLSLGTSKREPVRRFVMSLTQKSWRSCKP
jgi:hypothetical protein